MGAEQRLTLTALQMMIRDSIVLALPGSYWITAEIAELKVNYSGHCYLEVIEKNPVNNTIRARARGVIWAARFRSIQPLFESVTGESLREGISVLIKVSVEYHELYGLSLNITDIDPAYTVGDMAMKRMEIIRRLTDDGIIYMNSELEFPSRPGRIAIISSASSAGYTDFLTHLTENSYGYKFTTELFNAPMQGEETEKGILAPLDTIAARLEQFDLAGITIGGGLPSDLRWFVRSAIAFHVTQFPIPVVTGIGHEKDVTVTDMVAWKSLKTPTAVASFLIEKVHDTDLLLQELAGRLMQAARYITLERGSVITTLARRIIPTSSILLSDSRERLSTTILNLSSQTGTLIRSAGMKLAIMNSSLKSETKRTLAIAESDLSVVTDLLKTGSREIIWKQNQQLNAAQGLIKMADPANILKKGFSLTTRNGRTVRSAKELNSGDIISSHFHDGEVISEVN